MELNKNWWTAADWGDFDNEQRKKTVEWCEKHLAKYFGLEANYCNQFVKPPVARNKRFSTLKDFSEDRIGYYANSMMRDIVWILGCWNPINFRLFHIESAPMIKPYFIDYAGKAHHSEDECRKADEEFKELFSDLFNAIGEEKMNEIRNKKMTDGVKEYKVIAPNGEHTESYDNFKVAVERAMHLSSFYFNGIFGGGDRITKHCDFKTIDWTKENSFDIPKEKQVARFLYHFNDTSYIDRLKNQEQDDEFLEFLASL